MKPEGTSYLASLLLLVLFCAAPGIRAADIDWGQVESKNIKVFYPGVTSWEFLTGKDHGTGGNVVKKIEKACADCHIGKDGSYDIKSDKIIAGQLNKADSGDPLEPEPLSGMPGFKDITVQAAYDADNMYLRIQWPGTGGSTSEEDADRVSVQFADKIKTFNLYGCFISCHDDETGMPDNRGEKKTLYGYYAAGKSQDKLDGYLSKDQFIDLWEAYFIGTDVKTKDGYVLDARHDDNDDVSATGSFEGGKYTVVMSRKLKTGDKGDLPLEDGKSFSIGISIHDNKNKDRKHYVSFPISIGLSASGDIKAKKF